MKVFVVVPNWNGLDSLAACLDTLLVQSQKASVIVVENGSTDGSLEFLEKNYPQVELVVNKKNLGFAGGVNSGIKRAIELGGDYVALFNNDALAEKDWLKHLVSAIEQNPEAGIVTGKFVRADRERFDSTGDIYTSWGIPYPRGRDEPVSDKYDHDTWVFGATGGASLYRTKMLEEIGLFDEHFFAYLEDVDISFRAQLAGWKVKYVPGAVAYHHLGMTSGKVKGFSTYHYMKNVPMAFWKNVPRKYLLHIYPRLFLAYWSIMAKSILTGRGIPALKGYFYHLFHFPQTLRKRRRIQRSKKSSDEYIWSIITHDIPPFAKNLRKLRSILTLGLK